MYSEEIIERIPAEFDGNEIEGRIRECFFKGSALSAYKKQEWNLEPSVFEERMQVMDCMWNFVSECEQSFGCRSSNSFEQKLAQGDVFLDREELAILGLDLVDYWELSKLLCDSSYEKLFINVDASQQLYLLAERLGNTFSPDLEMLDTASPELKSIRTEMKKVRTSLQSRVRKTIEELSQQNVLQDDYSVDMNGRIVLLLKADFRGKVNGVVHGVSKTGQSVYYEPSSLLAGNNQLQDLIEGELTEIRRILLELNSQVYSSSKAILDALDYLKWFDMNRGMALFCREINACRPYLSSDDELYLSDFFHPLIPSCVSNSVKLSKTERMVVLSGPNSGGKTVTLKSIALCFFLAGLGMYVPARQALLPSVKKLFWLFGDYQSLTDSLSSFAAHLKRWRKILRSAKEGSFLFVDEIMNATDPREGEILAIELLQYLNRREVRGFVSTHYSGVKKLAVSDSSFVNGSMIFDQDKLEPTYVLSMGIPGSSYGIELAQKFSFPKSVIHAAKAALGTKHFELNHLIEKQKLQYMKLQGICDKHEKLHQELKRMEKQARAAYRLFEEQRENYLHRAYDNALKELHKFRKKWEPVLSDSAQPESETHSVAVKDAETSSSFMEEFSGKQKKFARKREVYRERQSLECGDTVEVFSYNKQGVLVDFSANGAKARVRLGNLDITVPVSELRRIGAAPATTSIPKVRGKGYSVQMSAPGNDSLNLLGEKIDDALITLENYLDSTAIAGYKSVQIVCGKGKLKDAILSVVSRHVLTAGKKIEFPNDGTVRIFLES